ncbi:hypothetical protein AA0117_g13007 [Alternaria alternata]|uniref:Uncharacterized protein n=1 Tax=Alternaria alternata TaxID=5599 RepID=A0A4Q4MXD1_ALTAL|nr:hypothetical protein AA0117_g13007 [Alternaria alternata]
MKFFILVVVLFAGFVAAVPRVVDRVPDPSLQSRQGGLRTNPAQDDPAGVAVVPDCPGA